MSVKKQNKVESVRQQWTRQRTGDPVSSRESSAVPTGRHFASSSSATPSETPSVAPDARKAAIQSVPLVPLEPEQQNKQRQLKIVGASGEMPAIPMRLKHSPALPYSRYNKRYVSHPQRRDLGSVVGSFSTEPLEGAPAYAWRPFVVYGAACVFLSAVWCLSVKVLIGKPPAAGDLALTLGLVLLCGIVLSGMALVAATSFVTLRNDDEFVKADVVASALGKTTLMLLAGVAAWILATAVVTEFAIA